MALVSAGYTLALMHSYIAPLLFVLFGLSYEVYGLRVHPQVRMSQYISHAYMVCSLANTAAHRHGIMMAMYVCI